MPRATHKPAFAGHLGAPGAMPFEGTALLHAADFARKVIEVTTPIYGTDAVVREMRKELLEVVAFVTLDWDGKEKLFLLTDKDACGAQARELELSEGQVCPYGLIRLDASKRTELYSATDRGRKFGSRKPVFTVSASLSPGVLAIYTMQALIGKMGTETEPPALSDAEAAEELPSMVELSTMLTKAVSSGQAETLAGMKTMFAEVLSGFQAAQAATVAQGALPPAPAPARVSPRTVSFTGGGAGGGALDGAVPGSQLAVARGPRLTYGGTGPGVQPASEAELSLWSTPLAEVAPSGRAFTPQPSPPVHGIAPRHAFGSPPAVTCASPFGDAGAGVPDPSSALPPGSSEPAAAVEHVDLTVAQAGSTARQDEIVALLCTLVEQQNRRLNPLADLPFLPGHLESSTRSDASTSGSRATVAVLQMKSYYAGHGAEWYHQGMDIARSVVKDQPDHLTMRKWFEIHVPLGLASTRERFHWFELWQDLHAMVERMGHSGAIAPAAADELGGLIMSGYIFAHQATLDSKNGVCLDMAWQLTLLRDLTIHGFTSSSGHESWEKKTTVSPLIGPYAANLISKSIKEDRDGREAVAANLQSERQRLIAAGVISGGPTKAEKAAAKAAAKAAVKAKP